VNVMAHVAHMIGTCTRIPARVCLALLCVPGTSLAQSVDLTAGGGMTWGGRHDYVSRGTAVLSFSHAPLQSGSVTHAFSVVARPQLDYSEQCLLLPDNSCAPRLHGSVQVGALVGGDAHSNYRGAVGPLLHFGRTQGLGFQAVGDVACGKRMAAVLAVRGAWVVLRDGETLQLGSVELGVRYRGQ
jgi:hypothetical protein